MLMKGIPLFRRDSSHDLGKVIFTLLVFVMLAPMAHADRYITFNNGDLYVFPDDCVSSFETRNGTVTVVDLNGGVYSYAQSSIASIDNSLPKALPVFTSYKFNNKYNYQVVTDAIGVITDDEVNVEVGGIGKWLTASFALSDSLARAYVDGVEQVSTVTRMPFGTSKTYLVAFPGDMILTRSVNGTYGMVPYGKQYTVNVDFLTDYSTTVPRIDINTVGGEDITSKEYYLDAEIIIDGAGVYPSMTDSVKIKGRGNTSWSSDPAAKNPYRLKFASKRKPLGLTNGKNWVLIANKMTGSMLTNAIGMKAASLIGTPAANHIIPVDLYINGTYKGNYNFTEKVGISNNSVEVLDETVAAMLELDLYYDEPEEQKFRSTPSDVPVNIKHPEFGEDETFLTLSTIQSRFDAFDRAVTNGEDLSDYVDIDYMARYMMFSELICNKEIYHPKSLFLYIENMLDDTSKFIFGPVWDLDWACGYMQAYPVSYFNKLVDYDFFNTPYTGAQYEFISSIGKNGKVSRRMFQLWIDFMGDKLDELCDFCAEYYAYAKPSIQKSKTVYPDAINYATQSTWAARWLRQRANLIYERLKAEHLIIGDVDYDGLVTINDVTSLIDYMLSARTDEFTEMLADVDGDGVVGINDLTSLIDELLAH